MPDWIRLTAFVGAAHHPSAEPVYSLSCRFNSLSIAASVASSLKWMVQLADLLPDRCELSVVVVRLAADDFDGASASHQSAQQRPQGTRR